MNIVITNSTKPLIGVFNLVNADPNVMPGEEQRGNVYMRFSAATASGLYKYDFVSIGENPFPGSPSEKGNVSTAPNLVKSIANGGALDVFHNSVFVNSARASVKGLLGLRSPVDAGDSYIDPANQPPEANIPLAHRQCKPCGVPILADLVAYDLDNIVQGQGSSNWLKAYYAFWRLEYPLTEYDVFEPVNEKISPEYIFKGATRTARNYRIGLFLPEPSFSVDSVKDGSGGGSIVANFDTMGIPAMYDKRHVTLRVSLDIDYIVPGSSE